MLYGFTYAGRHSSEFNMTVTSIKRKLHAPLKSRIVSVPQKPGAYNYGKPEIGHLVIEVSVVFTASDNETYHDLRREISAWLYRDEEVELRFDDEPDKYYMAQFSEESDINRIGSSGSATLIFIASDPYAYGETKTQRIANPGVAFRREGIRYTADGTEVTEDYPIYRGGKYDAAVVIEEGTENLLVSASAPTQEIVTAQVGADYYLSTVGGSATIEHAHQEDVNATLDISGTGFQYTDNDWSAGSLTNVEAINRSLRLRKGNTFSRVWNSAATWNASENIRNGVSGASGDLDMVNLPWWDFIDYMRNYQIAWKVEGDNVFSQQSDHLLINAPSPVSQQTRIYTTHGYSFSTATVDFKASISGTGMKLWVTNGTRAWRVYLPSTGGVIRWFRVRLGASAQLYIDGTPTPTTVETPSSTTRNLQFYLQNAGDSAVMRLYRVFFIVDEDLGPPNSGHWHVGTWETPYFSLSSVGSIQNAILNWAYYYTSDSLDDAGISIEYRLRIGSSEQQWVTIFNNATQQGENSASITGLVGADASNISIKLRITLRTRCPYDFPFIDYLEMSITPGYFPVGYRDSQIIDISSAGSAAISSITWEGYEPTNTAIRVYTRFSTNGGTTWTPWAQAENGGSIPGITPSTDLSNGRLQTRVELVTNDPNLTPAIKSLTVSLGVGYESSKIIVLSPVSVSDVGVAASSVITWDEETPSGTSITVEASLDGYTWSEVANGGKLVLDDTNLSEKSIHIRAHLATNDALKTPVLRSIEWKIAQREPHHIRPATGTLILTPNNVERWQLEKKTYPTGWHAYGTPRKPETAYVPIMFKPQGTIELWAYDDGHAYERYIFDTGPISLKKADNKYALYADGETAEISSPSPGWHHWAVRWDESSADIFLDGALAGTITLDNPIDFSGVDRLYIGCSAEGNKQWNGTIDDLRISSVARSDSEIADIANSDEPAPADQYTDFKANFDNSLAPAVDSSIQVGGTAPTQAIFRAEFIGHASYFKISDGIDFIMVETNFEPGDVLEIDCVRQVCRKNGSRDAAMPFLHLDSNFFDLKPGGEVFCEPTGAARVDATFVERWR